MITNEELNIFIDNIVNQRNYLTFAKLLGIRDPGLYKNVIELLYENRISTEDIEALDIVDGTSIRILLDAYNLKVTPALLYNSNLTSTFDAKSYLDGFTTGNTKVKDLIATRNLLETLGVPIRTLANSFRVTLNKETPVAYSSVSEVSTRFIADVLPNVKQDMVLSNIQDIRASFPLVNNLGLPVNSWKTTVEGFYTNIMGEVLPYLEDSQLCFLMIDIDDKYSALSMVPSIFHGLLNYEKIGSIVKRLKVLSSFGIASNGSEYSLAEIAAMKDAIVNSIINASLVTENLSKIRYDAALISVAESYLLTSSNIDELITSLDIINDILVKFKPLVASIEKWTSNSMRSIRI